MTKGTDFPAWLSRRRWLQVSGLGWLASSLPGIGHRHASALENSTGSRLAPIKSCIIVFHYGGPSHFETYDPKPLAPAGIRGEYENIATAVPGITVGEYLPSVA